jgi:AcrR family transcriptional regulator
LFLQASVYPVGMATKGGTYPKGIARREQILETALEVIAERGYSGATVRQIAEAAGLSVPGLQHHFGSKEGLLAEVLRRRDSRAVEAFEETASPEIAETFTTRIRGNTAVPGLIQLYARLSAEATEPSHPSHEYFRERYESIRAAAVDGIRTAQQLGQLRSGLNPEMVATMLLALEDGLQIQWLFSDDVDIAAHVGYFLELLGARPAEH